jgi:peptide subunit release factor RF-3
MWDTLSQDQKQEYFDIPHFSWEWFTYITGIEKTI